MLYSIPLCASTRVHKKINGPLNLRDGSFIGNSDSRKVKESLKIANEKCRILINNESFAFGTEDQKPHRTVPQHARIQDLQMSIGDLYNSPTQGSKSRARNNQTIRIMFILMMIQPLHETVDHHIRPSCCAWML